MSSTSETGTPKSPVRVLLVEDDEDDYRLTRDLLWEIDEQRFVLERVPGYAAAVEVMSREEHDVYLVDYRLGMHDGLELLSEPVLSAKPVIMLTGLDDRDVDLKAMAVGAADYLVKGKIDAPLLERSIRYAIERKQMEKKLRRQAEALGEADRRKDEFLAMLSHELRNPLAPIMNAVEMLQAQQGNENPIQREARTIIHRQVGQLARIVDDLLEVSRITTGRVQLRRERIALTEVVEHGVATVRPLIDQHKHELTLSLPTQPIWVYADATRLEQVVVNLLSNAAKYTNEGGHLWLALRQDDDMAVLRVRDTGIGIAPEILPRIFDLFTQADGSLDRSQGGLGIGLALVQRLVEMQEGRIEVQSAVGQGSEFVVYLPVVSSPEPQPLSPPSEEAQSIGRFLRVLLADDEVDTARSFSFLLKSLGHDVRTAHDGPAALEAALDYRPDVAFLDLGLPDLDGYEVAKRIRFQPMLDHVVLVAFTGYGNQADRERSKKAGFDHHLVKPVRFESLKQILATQLQKAT